MLIFSSCKNSSTEPENVNFRLVTEKIYRNNDTTLNVYAYDNQNRLNNHKIYQFSISQSVPYMENYYEYSNNNVFIVGIKNAVDTANVITYNLNIKGLAESSREFNYRIENGTPVVDTIDSKYFYNSDGRNEQTIRQTNHYIYDTINNIYLNSNLVEMIEINHNAQNNVSTQKIYLFTYLVKTDNILGNERHGLSFLGSSSKELILSSRSSVQNAKNEDFYYTFNSINRVSMLEVKIANQTDLAYVVYYTYK